MFEMVTRERKPISIQIPIILLVTLVMAAYAIMPGFVFAGGSENGGRQVTSLDISKDVDRVSAPGYVISLEKTASESEINMEVGSDHPVSFTIRVGASQSGAYGISGNIFVENTGEWPANVIAVSDTVWYKAGGPAWLPAATSVTTTVPIGPAAIGTGNHVYSYSGTFTLPVPLASVTAMSNLIEITIDNHPPDGVHVFHYRQDFSKPQAAGSIVSLSDVETISPANGLSYTIDSVTINGSSASLSGPWSLDLANVPFTVIVNKTLHASAAGDYVLNNKAVIGELVDEVNVLIHVPSNPDVKGAVEGFKLDEAQAAVAGVTIQLWSGDLLVAETVTDELGYYSFAGLELGSYTVREIVPAGWFALSSIEVPADLVDEQAVRVDFTNARFASISGTKWNDLNGNGIRDEGEPGLEGVLISLEGESIYRQAITAADGTYSFESLRPGTYTVSETVPDGWTNTTPASLIVTIGYGEGLAGVDFLNAEVLVAGEVIAPPAAEADQAEDHLPLTGFDQLVWLILAGALILMGLTAMTLGLSGHRIR